MIKAMDRDDLWFAFGVGFSTMIIDLLFHTLLTTPEETPAYFLAKFILAFVVALGFRNVSVLLGLVVGGAVFDILTGVYYGIAYYANAPLLSCCFLTPPSVSFVPYTTYFSLGGYIVSSWLFAFATVHFAAFAVSFGLLAWWMED